LILCAGYCKNPVQNTDSNTAFTVTQHKKPQTITGTMLNISVKNTENPLNNTADNYTATVKYYWKIVKITDFNFTVTVKNYGYLLAN